MKLIDERGRLFGKLNIIDALVLLIVIAAVAVVGVKVVTNRIEAAEAAREAEEQEAGEENWIAYTVKATAVEPEIYEVVERFVDADSGGMDQMINYNGGLDAFIVGAEATPHVIYTESGEIVEDGTRLDIVFTCVANVSDFDTNRVGAQEVRAGIPHILKSTHFEFQSGEVISVTWTEGIEELDAFVDVDALKALREAIAAEEDAGEEAEE